MLTEFDKLNGYDHKKLRLKINISVSFFFNFCSTHGITKIDLNVTVDNILIFLIIILEKVLPR